MAASYPLDDPKIRTSCDQTKPDREPLRVDDDVDLGREAASGTSETMRSIPPFFAVAAC